MGIFTLESPQVSLDTTGLHNLRPPDFTFKYGQIWKAQSSVLMGTSRLMGKSQKLAFQRGSDV